MPTPITANSPALFAITGQYGANHPYVQRIVAAVNASPYPPGSGLICPIHVVFALQEEPQ